MCFYGLVKKILTLHEITVQYKTRVEMNFVVAFINVHEA